MADMSIPLVGWALVFFVVPVAAKSPICGLTHAIGGDGPFARIDVPFEGIHLPPVQFFQPP
jgi:hypothetical protein